LGISVILSNEVSALNELNRMPQQAQLKDLRSVHIDASLPVPERIRSFVQQIGDPYHYKVGDVVVTVSYNGDGETLTERFADMLSLME
jgi:hypothetical protein